MRATATIGYDFTAWPRDGNDLTVRLYLWFSRNTWLLV